MSAIDVAKLTVVLALFALPAPSAAGAARQQPPAPAAVAPWSPVAVPGPADHPAELLALAEAVRAMDADQGPAGAVPDHVAIADRQRAALSGMRDRLRAIDTSGWSVHARIDYLLVRSELDELDFTLQVLRPTSRNPSFWVNAAIGNVGRHLTGGRYLRGDRMPYSAERARAILRALADTGALLAQARTALTEIVPELVEVALEHPGGGYYTAGGQLRHIRSNYERWATLTAEHFPAAEAAQLLPAARKAADELLAFGEWLTANKPRWTGQAAIGTDALNWYTRHVLLMPYDARDLELQSQMERARALTFLQMEQHKNRHLPPIAPAKTSREYLAWDDETALALRRWYVEQEQLLSDRDYMLDVRSEEGLYLMPFGLIAFPTAVKPGVKRILLVPADHWRAVHSNMGFRTDPGVLHGHEYWPGHYYEGEVHRRNPCPIRRGHRDGAHSQGWCFHHEELPVLLDFPYVRGDRARELVYVNNLQRAWRILLSLRVLDGRMTAAEARETLQREVPALGPGLGVRPEEAFEEVEGILQRGLDHCQTGKLQIWQLLADRKMQLKEQFDLRAFHDQVITLGSVPISLLRWEIAGLDDEAKSLWSWQPLPKGAVARTAP